jgi:16S rRNA (cytosine1402-N4)-methyltransferase
MAENPQGYHIPVMLAEVLKWLAPQSGETHCDLTLGGGGHSYAIAEKLIPQGTLIGVDRDLEAISAATKRLQPFQALLSIILLHSSFENIRPLFTERREFSERPLDGVLLDLGVSSHQLDTERGFSFRRDEPLDMRMDTSTGVTAAEWLAQASEAEIARVLWEYGEERWSRRVAQRVVEARQKEPLRTTAQLVSVIERAIPRSAYPPDTHVATRTFQGIRIHLNREMEQLETVLEDAIELLKPGGRIVVLSYHSLEDRIVKQAFAKHAGKVSSPPGSSLAALLPSETGTPDVQLLTKKPELPSPEEVARNPRARSAKLRAVRRIR